MTVLRQRVEVYKKFSGDTLSWPSSPTFIDPLIYNINTNVGSGSRKDTFSFQIANFNNEFFGTKFNVFDIGDNVKIFFNSNGTTFGFDELAMDGIITDITQSIGATGGVLS